MIRRLSLVFTVVAFCAGADVIPSARRYDWQTNAGVPDGFETVRVGWATSEIGGLDNTGANDCSSTIQTAINNASNDTILTIPAGTFRLNSTINLAGSSNDKQRRVLRGAGMGTTTLMLYNASSVSLAGALSDVSNSHWTFPSGVTVTSPAAAGATSITLSNGTNFLNAVGLQIQLCPPNIPDDIVMHVSGYEYQRNFVGVITGGSGNSVEFTPPLPFAIASGSLAFRENGNGVVGSSYRLGLESLTVDATNSSATNSVYMGGVRQSWIYAVESYNAANVNIGVGPQATQCTIQKCRAELNQHPELGTNRKGYSINATAMLFQDNIGYDLTSSMEVDAGCTASVFAYNYMDNIVLTGVIGPTFDVNHAPHNSFNLFEGNVMPRLQSDGYFGGSSQDTIFRNWLHGTAKVAYAGYQQQYALTMNRFSRQSNIVANMLGRKDVGITWTYTNIGIGFDTTSSTSLTIGTGAVSATIGTGLSYSDNGTVAIFVSNGNNANWMTGRITSYVSGTGSCTFTVYATGGSGTHSDWTVKGGGGYGANTSQGYIYTLGMPNIGNGGFGGTEYNISAPQTYNIWWRNWDGTAMVRQGAFSGSNAYTVGDVVDYNTTGPWNTTGGAGILNWIAVNPAKNGLTTWATPSDAQSDWQPISSNGFQELDYDVYATAIIKGNWNAYSNGIHSSEAMGGDTYPDSYYLSSKPSWFGTMTWPPIDPTNPPTNHDQSATFVLIPAAWRAINGNENYLSGGTPTPHHTPRAAAGVLSRRR